MKHRSSPSKYTWKAVIKSKIRSFYERAWKERLENDTDFARFKLIHPELKSSNIWSVALDKPSAHAIFLVARLCTLLPQTNYQEECFVCGRYAVDIMKHIVTSCSGFTQERERFITHTTNNISAEISRFLRNTNFESLYCRPVGSQVTYEFGM